jgi:hypothetical protein
MRVTKNIDATAEELKSAKDSALSLVSDSFNASDLFYCTDLEYIENGIKKLNDFSGKAWLLSAILLYTIIFDRELYSQSGLSWSEYTRQSRQRLGMDQREITDQLAAARFFILHHAELEEKGFKPDGNYKKLARAELAARLSNSVDLTIEHLINDTREDFTTWYFSYKKKKKKRDDIKIENGKYYIKDIEAVTISNDIPEADRKKIDKCMGQIFKALEKGITPKITMK